MAESKKGVVGRPRTIVRDSKTGVFIDVRAPGLERVRILDRDVYEKASARAGTALKNMVGNPRKGIK
jgi:hypothetical protein